MGDHHAYRAHLVRQGLRPKSIRAYVQAVSRLEQWAGKPIGEVTPDEAAAWINRPGNKRSTRNTYHRHLSVWCEWSGSDLLDDVRRTSAGEPAPKPITPAQADLMLAACRDDEDSAILLLGLLAGLRCAEISGFSGGQIDRWDATLSVVGKGDKDATIPAPPALLRHARSMPFGLWFPSPKHPGRAVTDETIRHRVVRIGNDAGVGHVTPHRLRHTYATQMVKGGTPLSTVRKCMRHSQLATTAIYLLVSDEDMAAAAASLPWAA